MGRPAVNYVGQTFETFTVIERASPVGTHEVSWKCRCKCGRTVSMTLGNLKRQKSCGCLNQAENAAFNVLLRIYRGNAKARDRSFTITAAQFKKLTSSPCYFTGRYPEKEICTDSGDVYVYNGIDRLDNNKGYTLKNCVPCCAEVNYAKRELPASVFISLCKEIASKN